jgi:D-glycero-alpha-D-manno-heptose-7-phosphate kinase
MVVALESADIDALGHLLGEHWVHQRSLDPAIPTPLIDAILDDAAAAGALGGKALGASGGGCVLTIAAAGNVDEVRRVMGERARLLPVRIARHGFQIVRRSAPAATS